MVTVPFTRKRDLRDLKEHTLQLTTEVIYLGLILHKGLTWKTQVKNVMNKAYRAFWACNGTLDLHYGDQTYSSTLWWPRVR
jgi:hypothetical protein